MVNFGDANTSVEALLRISLHHEWRKHRAVEKGCVGKDSTKKNSTKGKACLCQARKTNDVEEDLSKCGVIYNY